VWEKKICKRPGAEIPTQRALSAVKDAQATSFISTVFISNYALEKLNNFTF
jgi:hypothetical protein